jgi:hypothetical protein
MVLLVEENPAPAHPYEVCLDNRMQRCKRHIGRWRGARMVILIRISFCRKATTIKHQRRSHQRVRGHVRQDDLVDPWLFGYNPTLLVVPPQQVGASSMR